MHNTGDTENLFINASSMCIESLDLANDVRRGEF